MSVCDDMKNNEKSRAGDPLQVFNDLEDLPSSYDETQLTLIARDPSTIHAYWDITPDAMEELQEAYHDDWDDTSCVLRIHNMSGSEDNVVDTDVGFEKKNWYITTEDDDSSFYGELGFKTPEGDFVSLCESNCVTTPRNSVSERHDLMWLDPNDESGEGMYVEAERISEPPPQQNCEPEEETTVSGSAELEPDEELSSDQAPLTQRDIQLPKVENSLPPDVKPGLIPPQEPLSENLDITNLKEEQQLYLDKEPYSATDSQDYSAHNIPAPVAREDIPDSIKEILNTSSQPSVFANITEHKPHQGEVDHDIMLEKVLLEPEDLEKYYASAFPEQKQTTLATDESCSRRPSMSEVISKKQHAYYQLKQLDTTKKQAYYQKIMTGASEQWLQGASREFGGGSEPRLRHDDFFFELKAELVVSGRTEPDARVRLGFEQIKLNDDGTFTLHFDLPDGKIPLEFVAESNDQLKHRIIKTLVEREKTSYS